MLHCTMPCHAMPYHAILNHAIPHNAMPCHAMPCHTIPHPMPYYAMSRQCHTMPCHVAPCHTIPCPTILCHTTPFHTDYYSPPTHCLPLTTYHSPPTTHRLLLTTYYYYSPPTHHLLTTYSPTAIHMNMYITHIAIGKVFSSHRPLRKLRHFLKERQLLEIISHSRDTGGIRTRAATGLPTQSRPAEFASSSSRQRLRFVSQLRVVSTDLVWMPPVTGSPFLCVMLYAFRDGKWMILALPLMAGWLI